MYPDPDSAYEERFESYHDELERDYVEPYEHEPGDNDEEYFNDDMDGDFDSAMASAGYGTDEDYGDFGGSDDW